MRPPAALGVEGTGTILAVGADVHGVAVGDRVLAHVAPLPGGSGFWAEQVLLETAPVAVRHGALDPVHAAALPVAGLTARQALDTLGLQAGQRQRNADRLRRLGAAAIVDYRQPDWPEQTDGPFDAAPVAAHTVGLEYRAIIATHRRTLEVLMPAWLDDRANILFRLGEFGPATLELTLRWSHPSTD